MKDKLVRTPFDIDAYEKKVKERWEGYEGELQRTTDKKSELFIQVNYFHSCLDDAMEFLLKTDLARGIHPKKVIRILFEKSILEDKDAKDAIKINQIKNFFAHDHHKPNIQSDAEKIINKMKIEILGLTVQPDGTFTDYSKLVEEMEESFDMYQKLDFIIHNLTRDIEHKVIFMKD
jgi:hypothetical protein